MSKNAVQHHTQKPLGLDTATLQTLQELFVGNRVKIASFDINDERNDRPIFGRCKNIHVSTDGKQMSIELMNESRYTFIPKFLNEEKGAKIDAEVDAYLIKRRTIEIVEG